MSEYHTIKVVFVDESILIQSLKEMGYEAEVHDEGVVISNTRFGPNQYNKAHIVVRKKQFNGFGDIGFERTEKGFVMHADDYDSGVHGERFGIGILNKKYVENKLKKYVSFNSNCNIFSRKENEQGQLEIQLTRLV